MGAGAARVVTSGDPEQLQVRFTTPGAMKWACELTPLHTDGRGILTVRYRAVNVAAGDYLLWFGTPAGGRSIAGAWTADGTWRTLAIDLAAHGLGDVRIEQVALSLTSAGGGEIAVDSLAYARAAPDQAEPSPPHAELPPVAVEPAAWTPQPTWVANAAADAAQSGQEFRVSAAGKGMKWSAFLPALHGHRRLRLTLSARGMALSDDFAVMLITDGAGPYHSLVQLDELQGAADRAFDVPIPAAARSGTLVVQVQAGRAAATLRVMSLTLHDQPTRPFATLMPPARTDLGFEPLVLEGESVPRQVVADLGARDWLASPEAVVEGVRFRMSAVPVAGNQRVIVDRPVGALCLLLASRLNSPDYAQDSPRRNDRIDQVTELVAHVRYADRETDASYLLLPLVDGRLRATGLTDGVSVACLPRLRSARISIITLAANLNQSAVYLLGAASHPDLTLPAPEAPVFPYFTPVSTAPAESRMVVADRRITVSGPAARYEVALADDGTPRLGIRGTACRCRIYDGPLWRLDGHPMWRGEVRQVDDVTARLSLTAGPAEVTVTIRAEEGGELGVAARFRGIAGRLRFPSLAGLRLSGDDWYVIPTAAGYIDHAPITVDLDHSHFMPLPMMALFAPISGESLYVVARDRLPAARRFLFAKAATTEMAIAYDAADAIDHDVVIGVGHGGWRDALAAYTRHNVDPIRRPGLAWFQDLFNYRSQMLEDDLYDAARGEFRFVASLEQTAAFTGPVDYLNLFDFAKTPDFGRVCDYGHWYPFGSPGPLKAAIEKVQAAGTRVGLYVEGYICSKRSLWGRDRWRDLALKGRDHEPLLFAADNDDEPLMCPFHPDWAAHLAGVYRDLAAALAPDGLYIDEFGYVGENRRCFDPDHGHPVGAHLIGGEHRLLTAVEPLIPDGVAFHGEYAPPQSLVPFYQGSLSYSLKGADRRRAFTGVDLYRFVFPWLKIFQIGSYEPYAEGNEDVLKRVFFNAEGLYSAQKATPRHFSPLAQRLLKRGFGVLRRYRAAFRDPAPRPLVPTAERGVFVNEFHGGGATVWSILNTNPWPIETLTITSDRMRNGRCREAWANIPVTCRASGGVAVGVPAQGIAFLVSEPSGRF